MGKAGLLMRQFPFCFVVCVFLCVLCVVCCVCACVCLFLFVCCFVLFLLCVCLFLFSFECGHEAESEPVTGLVNPMNHKNEECV